VIRTVTPANRDLAKGVALEPPVTPASDADEPCASARLPAIAALVVVFGVLDGVVGELLLQPAAVIPPSTRQHKRSADFIAADARIAKSLQGREETTQLACRQRARDSPVIGAGTPEL
jgi:hypothetical protein